MFTLKEKEIIRDLAKRYAEIAADPVNNERISRMRRINGLIPDRPPVWIEELPWHEMDINGQLSLCCENPDLRNMEFFFRSKLFRWKYFQADMIVENVYYITKAMDNTGYGVSVAEERLSSDEKNHIYSHHYIDQLDTEEKIEKLQVPVVTARPEIDKKNLALAQDILGDILPVKLQGHGIYHAPWDTISELRGVEPALIDMMDRPELIHKTISRLTAIGLATYEQMEEQGLLDFNVPSLHCTPPYCDELPAPDYDAGKVRMKDVWFRGMAQMFSTVSPDMHEEFDLQYMRRIMNRCRLSYYGCCEPLDTKFGILKKIPNLRKIGVSPWSNVRLCAEQIGGDYVFARKPNPAYVADTFSAEAVAREISQTLEVCIEFGCPCELVLKDISTVSYKPQNIIDWNNTVQRTVDRFYK